MRVGDVVHALQNKTDIQLIRTCIDCMQWWRMGHNGRCYQFWTAQLQSAHDTAARVPCECLICIPASSAAFFAQRSQTTSSPRFNSQAGPFAFMALFLSPCKIFACRAIALSLQWMMLYHIPHFGNAQCHRGRAGCRWRHPCQYVWLQLGAVDRCRLGGAAAPGHHPQILMGLATAYRRGVAQSSVMSS